MVDKVDFESLSKSEFWRKKFNKLCEARDYNKDGYITRGDYIQMIGKYRAGCSNAKHIKLFETNMLKFCDKFGLVDESIKLTYDQFRDHWLVSVGGSVKMHNELLKVMFTCLDTDGNGYITLDEWKAHSEAVGGVPTEYAEVTFRALDADGNGKITQQEFDDYNFEFFYSTENTLKSASFFGPL